MKSYLDILSNIIENGIQKEPTRLDTNGNAIPVENGTIGLPNVVFSHNMADGFPLLTTKKMAFKTMCVELEGFINGVTDKKWYQERGCKIWDEWANPDSVNKSINELAELSSAPELLTDKAFRLEAMKNDTDLGPIYGYQWRNFGGQFGPISVGVTKTEHVGETRYHMKENGRNGPNKGYDQLSSIVDKLQTSPLDRRMVCSAWNPNQMNMMALPPCHLAWGVTVYGDYLNLWWTQRSVDTYTGLSFNIASYAMLLSLLCNDTKYLPGNLTGLLVDCHIYNNQMDAVKEQLSRDPYPLPTIRFTHTGNTLDWTHKDVELVDYKSHGKIQKVAITV